MQAAQEVSATREKRSGKGPADTASNLSSSPVEKPVLQLALDGKVLALLLDARS